jgi:hypothetical protein
MEQLEPDFPSRWVVAFDFVGFLASIGPLLRGEDHFEVAGFAHDCTGHCKFVDADVCFSVDATLGFFDDDQKIMLRRDVVALVLRRDLLGGCHLAVPSTA